MYGFGGMFPGSSAVSHCFALNGNIYDPEVKGIEAAVHTYYNSLKHTRLYGPTFFGPIIT